MTPIACHHIRNGWCLDCVSELSNNVDRLEKELMDLSLRDNIDFINEGCDIAADKLLEIAENGRNHGGVFGGPKLEAAAQAILKLREENERLKRGDFTEEEFQNLCHNFKSEDRTRFVAGCTAYQEKLFGCRE